MSCRPGQCPALPAAWAPVRASITSPPPTRPGSLAFERAGAPGHPQLHCFTDLGVKRVKCRPVRPTLAVDSHQTSAAAASAESAAGGQPGSVSGLPRIVQLQPERTSGSSQIRRFRVDPGQSDLRRPALKGPDALFGPPGLGVRQQPCAPQQPGTLQGSSVCRSFAPGKRSNSIRNRPRQIQSESPCRRFCTGCRG